MLVKVLSVILHMVLSVGGLIAIDMLLGSWEWGLPVAFAIFVFALIPLTNKAVIRLTGVNVTQLLYN